MSLDCNETLLGYIEMIAFQRLEGTTGFEALKKLFDYSGVENMDVST